MYHSIYGWSQKFEKGDINYNILSEIDKTVEVSSASKFSEDIAIPSEVNGYTVTNIGKNAFQYCTKLATITIHNSIISIGESAFEGCSSLTSITISNSVTSIEESTFYGCKSLTSHIIPNSVTIL